MFRVNNKTLYCEECVRSDPLGIIDNEEDIVETSLDRHFDTPWYCSGCGVIVAGALPQREDEEDKSYRLVLRDEYGSETDEYFDELPSPGIIEETATEFADPDIVSPEGGELQIDWVLYREDEVIDSDAVVVVVPADHEALIRRAVTGPHCGCQPKDHDWSSEGEGGCDQNPGVWSIGGNGIVVREHCEGCRLQREWYYPGVNALPGEHDTVKYSMRDE